MKSRVFKFGDNWYAQHSISGVIGCTKTPRSAKDMLRRWHCWLEHGSWLGDMHES